MAESKFLKWQDQNGDGLIDVCKVDVPSKELPDCPECKPDPAYVAPDWKERNQNQPWYDAKRLEYHITVVCEETSITPFENASDEEAADYVKSLFRKYQEEAIENLLLHFNKLDSELIRNMVREHLNYHRHYLDARPGSKVRLLYGIACENFINLPERIEDEGDEPEETGPTVVLYRGDDIFPKLMKFRKAMNLYARYYRVYQALNRGTLVEVESGKIFSPKQLQEFGDNGFHKSIMRDMIYGLDGWLNQKGLNLPGFGGLGGLFDDKVTKIEFTFSKTYILKKIRAWSVKCGDVPAVFSRKQLRLLKSQRGWNSPRACAYFAKLDEIEQDLTAREPAPWLEFIEKYTYPAVVGNENYGIDGTSCIGDMLRQEAKALGQDILDDVFSLGDAIAYAFNKSMCEPDLHDIEVMREKLGLVPEPGEPKGLKAINAHNVFGVAMEQAFKQMEARDTVFVEFCQLIASGFGTSSAAAGQAEGGGGSVDDATGVSDVKEVASSAISGNMTNVLWSALDRIKICGLKSIALDVLRCLLNGVSLEQALGRIVKSALKALSIDNFGKLFIGLPPEKQQELDALVRKKIEEGNIAKDGAPLSRVSIEINRPWDNQATQMNPDATVGDMVSPGDVSALNNEKSQPTDRTLAQRFDPQANTEGLDPNIVLEAYVIALIEVYSDDLLSLVDKLNDFPGYPLLARTIANWDCPVPPMFDPNFLDFIRSVDTPFCTGVDDIVLPKLINPFAWIPKYNDLYAAGFEMLRVAVQRIIVAIIIKLIVKICETLGKLLCKGLGAIGQIGKGNILDILKEGLCGPGMSQQQVEDTLAEMFAKFGVGGAAFANQEATLSYFADLSQAVTRAELLSAFQGEMSPQMAMIADNLIEFEYGEFREGLPTPESIATMFADAGTLFPADVRNAMQNFLNDLPPDDFAPANPTLCATPEQLEQFCQIREEMLMGRATSNQSREMCEELQEDLLDELEAIADILQEPRGPLANALPPLMTGPGASGDDCVPSLLPFEPDANKKAAATVQKGNLSQLELAFTKDMLGNGPGEKNWGMLNMVLSDTMGQPLTAHWRKANNRTAYVDFITDSENDPDAGDDKKWLFFTDPAPTPRQYGAHPEKVADWLQSQLLELNTSFNLNNSWSPAYLGYPKTFEELGIDRGNTKDPDTTGLGDLGYGVDFRVDGENRTVRFTVNGRKDLPDCTYRFRDNNKGRKEHLGTEYLYGFDVELYVADLHKNNGEVSNVGDAFKRGNSRRTPGDVSRIKVMEYFNFGEADDSHLTDMMTEDQKKEYEKSKEKTPQIITSPLYEFRCSDDTFSTINERDSITLRSYTDFNECFSSLKPYSPGVYLLYDIIKRNQSVSTLSLPTIESHIDSVMNEINIEMASVISSNPTPFQYGAKYDNIGTKMYDYVIGPNTLGYPEDTLYSDVEIDGEPIKEADAVMGISYDQYENGNEARVFYLNPATYGGKYTRPAAYVKPVKLEGWMGMVTVMFPDFTPCKPRTTDIIDFQGIQEEVQEIYYKIPDDQRLRSDPDCIVEKPYNRILQRASKAGLLGLIKASCRIYATTHFLKSFAAFATFSPKFPQNYSDIYAAYIVEDMEKSFKDAQGAGWEFFNPFKDGEFWYGFLEQSVQAYNLLLDSGEITDPPKQVLEAMFALNDIQAAFEYPFRRDLRKAKKLREVRLIKTLKNYRMEKNLEAVQASEEAAKVILKEFVKMELNIMGEKFLSNLEESLAPVSGPYATGTVGKFRPTYTEIDYYFLQNHVYGAGNLDLDKEIKETVDTHHLEESGSDHYTAGGALAKPDGTEYSGFYHVHTTADNEDVYMAGAYHSEDTHDVLTILANVIKVPIGDVQNFGDSIDLNSKFVLEKYTSINGIKYSPSDAYSEIMSAANPPEKNLSDIYPGTLQEVTNLETGAVTGITGELGVRHGLRFSTIINGVVYELTTVEVDALDVKIANYSPLTGDSKLLLCLLNHLRDDFIFKMCVQYIFPMKKILSTLAIYTDLGFLNSIGEVTVEDGMTQPNFENPKPSFDEKPGMKVKFHNWEQTPPDFTPSYESTAGWSSYSDRNQPFTPFVLDWDDWDREILRNSKSKIKRLFRVYYTSRKFEPFDDDKGAGTVKSATRNLREAFRRPSSARMPWFWRRRLRPNVFDRNGKLCDKNE
tara:strand:+ start:53456 stop:59908 length:6453 start_codon:yes stop_codon:yes gene_type:complete